MNIEKVVEKYITDLDNIIVSGDRCFDMGLRIKYGMQTIKETSKLYIEENIKRAIFLAFDKTPSNENLYILPTYSAMLDVRKILTGEKII